MKNPSGFPSCLRRLADACWLLLLLAAFAITNARGVTINSFDPSTWPRTDAAIGVTGFTIEDFEDTTLVTGLQVQLSGGTNDFAPTSTLPKTWDPSSNADDPNGAKVLATGIWDGSHVLLNRQTAVPSGYVDGEWADTTFIFTTGTASVGFSVQNLESANTIMTVKTSLGTTTFNLGSVANFTLSGGRNGYLRIDAAVGEAIFSVQIDNLGGDGFAFDHLAFLPVSSGPTQWTVGSGGNGHYYQAFAAPGGISWDQAQTNARAMGGYLATTLSAAENTFAFNLVNDPLYWFNDAANNSQGPWIGGFQPPGSSEPAGGWQWVHNDGAFVFTNWAGGEPSNAGGTENRLQFFGTGLNNRQATWNDSPPAPYAGVLGYVVEFDSYPSPARPIAHWKFDELSGGVAHDAIGSFDGTLVGGAAFVSGGISGNAISLSRATNSFVNAGTSFPGFLAGDYSLVAWVKTTDATTDSIMIASKHNGGSQNGYFLFTNTTGGGGATGKATFYASEFANQAPTSTTTVTDGQWHQVVGVYRAGAMHSIYVDGVPSEASTATTAMVANTSAFIIGGVGQNSSNGTPVGAFNGLIDDVQVYDFALSDSHIDFLFQNPGAEFQAAAYDLVTDWSDAMNPNCTWTYREGSNALQHFTASGGDFSSSQPLWAPSQNSIPTWFKSVGGEPIAHDWQAGDVITHTQDDNTGPGRGASNVIWTSPITDTITITGGVWEGRDIGRGNDWFLYKNNTLLTQGHVESGDIYSRANPFLFSAGSGGAAAVANIAVVPGDVIKLEFVKTSSFGDYVGVNMKITGSGLLPAPDVLTSAATNVAFPSATLNGSVNPNGTETSAYFEYGTTTSYGSTTAVQALDCGTSAVPLSANITGLSFGTTYHFRAVATTSAGTFYGPDMTFLGGFLRPIAHYRFDESSGTTALDSVGSFDGTLSATGSSFVSGGISGNAISLDRAAGGYVNMGTSFPGFTSGDFSVVAWVKTTTTENDILVVSKHNGGVTGGYLTNINPTGGGGAAGKATFYASDAFVAQSPTSATTVNDGAWHQIVGVYHAGGVHSVYVDGAPAEASTASQAMIANTSAFIVGGLGQFTGNGTPESRYTGLIDDVQVYDAALTDAQIDFLFAHPGQEFQPGVYDLATDWSDAMNPNCTWAYRAGTVALPHVNAVATGDFSSSQQGWGPSSGIIPAWFKSVGVESIAHDWQPGDVVVHTQDDASGAGNGVANVIWTSPGTDTIAITGGVWEGRDIGRGNDWFLYKNSTLLTQGHVESGDIYSRANPFLFSAGSGGAAAVANIAVIAGDVIKLELVRTTSAGDYVGVNLKITGSALISAPSVITSAASAVGATTATLNGSANPNGTETSVYFEYGTTTSYGSATPATNIDCGTSAVAATANVSGLTTGATYHFRAVALTSAGVIFGEDATFTPQPPPPTVTTGAATDVRARRATLNGSVNPNGVATSYHFEYGPDTNYGTSTATVSAGNGTSAVAASAVIGGLTPGALYHFRLVATTSGGTFNGADETFIMLAAGITPVAARDVPAPDENGAATAATFFSFGPPAIGDAGHLAFRATLTKNIGGTLATTDTGIWFEDNVGLRRLAREGDNAPVAALPFASFGDPVFASGDRVAFLAKLKTKTNATGIWSNVGGALGLVARLGDPAPGTTATFGAFVSLGLSDGDGPVFLAKLKGATPATDVGIFAADNTGAVRPVLVREGGQLDVGGGEMKTVATLQFLPVMKVVTGQTRGFNADGDLAFRATFTDKSFAIFKIVGGNITALAAKGGTVPGLAGASIATIAQPALDGAAGAAFLGTLTIGAGGVTKADDSAIFSQVGNAGAAIVARENDGAAAKFASFSEPVTNADGAVAFLAKLKTGTANVTPANASAIFSDDSGALSLLARQGFPARDATGQPLADGSLYAKFVTFALPDDGGPVYLAKLKRSKTVTAKNDTGIWAGDFAGGTTLVVRTGELLLFRGSAQKTVKLLQFLPPVRGVPGQSRNFQVDGYLSFRAVFTDRSEAIYRVLR